MVNNIWYSQLLGNWFQIGGQAFIQTNFKDKCNAKNQEGFCFNFLYILLLKIGSVNIWVRVVFQVAPAKGYPGNLGAKMQTCK